MNCQEFIDTLNRCLEKAELEYVWHATGDEDEEANIYVNNRGEIYINDKKTSYNCNNVSKIKFRQMYFDVDETGEEQDFYVKIWFETGDILRIGMKDFASYMTMCYNDSNHEK